MAALVIPKPLLLQIQSDGRQGYPHEVCGLILGALESGMAHAYSLRQSPNASRDHRGRSYFVPVEWLLTTHRDARLSGWEVVGAYHTHPDAEPEPSQRDVDEAIPDFIYLITSIYGDGRTSVRAWLLDGQSKSIEPVNLVNP